MHPTLFFIQIFSTLGYSILFSTLVLYSTKFLGLSSDVALNITGSFVALNFALHVIGGSLTGKLFSHRSLFFIGMILQSAGSFCIASGTLVLFYLGLGLFLTGSGLNVTCINCMLTQLYEPDDKNRESGFLWNYSGMNLGFFIGFTISGIFESVNSYLPLFLFGAFSNVLTIVILLLRWHKLYDRKTAYIESETKLKLFGFGLLIIVALAAAMRLLIVYSQFSNDIVPVFGLFMFLTIMYLTMKEKDLQAKKKLWAYFILACMSLVFWTLYTMAPMGLTLFVENNVDRTYFGFAIPPQWVLNVNTLVIIIFGPVLASFFRKQREKGYKITIPFQFTVALFLIGIGFLILPLGILFASSKGIVSFSFVVWSYIFQSFGELFISPIGYAMVGQLVPVRLQGFFMGIWLMVTGVAASLASFFSKIAIGKSHLTDPIVTNPTFLQVFLWLGVAAIIVGILMWILKKFVDKLIKKEGQYITPPAEPQ